MPNSLFRQGAALDHASPKYGRANNSATLSAREQAHAEQVAYSSRLLRSQEGVAQIYGRLRPLPVVLVKQKYGVPTKALHGSKEHAVVLSA